MHFVWSFSYFVLKRNPVRSACVQIIEDAQCSALLTQEAGSSRAGRAGSGTGWTEQSGYHETVCFSEPVAVYLSSSTAYLSARLSACLDVFR